MPNASTHAIFGVAAGSVYANARSQSHNDTARFLETVGGATGGYLGARLPDILEPAFCPSHRAFAHSITACGAVIRVGRDQLQDWEGWCRAKAAQLLQQSLAYPAGSIERVFLHLSATALTILAGALAGFVAGYASHLILDALTPNGLPLI
jgi:membrane-bound metal-dependent hydrolase YbcI (DUF457 family)